MAFIQHKNLNPKVDIIWLLSLHEIPFVAFCDSYCSSVIQSVQAVEFIVQRWSGWTAGPHWTMKYIKVGGSQEGTSRLFPKFRGSDPEDQGYARQEAPTGRSSVSRQESSQRSNIQGSNRGQTTRSTGRTWPLRVPTVQETQPPPAAQGQGQPYKTRRVLLFWSLSLSELSFISSHKSTLHLYLINAVISG